MDRSAAPLRVLVVEDCDDTGDSLRALLELWGCAARVARDGDGAVALAAAFRPDVALLDVGLPRADGYQVARRLCAALGYRPALVAVTGFHGMEASSRREGFDHHLLKPFEVADLEAILAGVARRPDAGA